MANDDLIAGQLGQCDCPDWRPLVTLVGGELADEFMWMSEIALADGTVAQAYKHIHTRRYLHIDEDGRTLACTTSGRYRPIDRDLALVLVFAE